MIFGEREIRKCRGGKFLVPFRCLSRLRGRRFGGNVRGRDRRWREGEGLFERDLGIGSLWGLLDGATWVLVYVAQDRFGRLGGGRVVRRETRGVGARFSWLRRMLGHRERRLFGGRTLA